MFNKLRENKRGVLNVVTGAVIAVIVAAVLIMVAAQIIANLSTSMPAVTGAANTTITNITTGSYNGLQLMTILPVVLAAAAIIAAVMGALVFIRGR